jgi:hypothetical protein
VKFSTVGLLLCASALAAQDSTTTLSLANGAQVEYQTTRLPGEAAHGEVTAKDNVIRRTLTDPSGAPWLGFQIRIERDGTAFRASFLALPGYPYFEQGPAPRQLRDGDRVLMDVIEQPKSGKKVYDAFRVFLPAGPQARNAAEPYVIAPGDTISIWVYQAPSLIANYVVPQSGTISVPLLGEIKAANLTTAQLGSALAERIKAAGISDQPNVTVNVLRVHSK